MKKDLLTKLEKAFQEPNEDLFFQLLFDEFRNYIIAWAQSFGLDHDRAFEPEDIVIEVFIKLAKNGLEPYSPNKFPTLGGLIYRVTQNTLCTNYRNGIRNSKDSLDGNISLDRIDALIEQPNSLEFDDLLNHLLGQIKPMEAAVFRLRLDGHSHKDIAGELGISVVNSRRYASQANQRLQDLVIKYFQSMEKL